MAAPWICGLGRGAVVHLVFRNGRGLCRPGRHEWRRTPPAGHGLPPDRCGAEAALRSDGTAPRGEPAAQHELGRSPVRSAERFGVRWGPKWAEWNYGPQDRTLASPGSAPKCGDGAGCPSRRLGSAWPRAGSRPASASRTGRCKRKGSMWPACNWTSTTGWALGRWLTGALGPPPRPIGSVDGAPIRMGCAWRTRP